MHADCEAVVGWERGHPEPLLEVDFARAVDELNHWVEANEKTQPDHVSLVAEAFDAVLVWCFVGAQNRLALKSALIRFVAVTALVRPALLDGRTYEELARALGLKSKSSIANIVVEFERLHSLKFRRSNHKRKQARHPHPP